MKCLSVRVWLAIALAVVGSSATVRGDVSSAEVERSIRRGVEYLKSKQQPDGTWPGEIGVTALVALALTTAGESVESPAIVAAHSALIRAPEPLNHETYTLGLKLMALSTNPVKYGRAMEGYAQRLLQSQIPATPGRSHSGAWSYQRSGGAGDNSNSQYAVLGLFATSESGIKVPASVWRRTQHYWESAQARDGSFSYVSGMQGAGTGSMTCAGISSLLMTGLKHHDSLEVLVGNHVEHCGDNSTDPSIRRGLDWLAVHFDVRSNINAGMQWKFYYLYGLERVGRLSGLRYFGQHDWYREGAEELVRLQDPIRGYWRGMGMEADPIICTSFALLFLAKGRSPVLVNKLKHGPGRDWNNDINDASNLAALVSRDWKQLVTWQFVDPSTERVEDLLQAPIAYISGHEAPIFSAAAKKNLREYVENGGLILADACCGRREFDKGFRELMKEVFPEQDYDLHALPPEHPVWRSRYQLDADIHPLWGIEHGCRTVVIYSPEDLSCYWNQMEAQPNNPRVDLSARIGQNIVDYATGRELPADKLAAREVGAIGVDLPKRGALQIAKLKHGGDWNIAPLAIPNLTTMLRDKLKFDVVINHKNLAADDPNIVNFPLIYIHGRGAVSFNEAERARIRRHLYPGGGTLFADAACGSASFDASFRRFVAELYPDKTLEPIPPHDEFFTRKVGFDLSDAQLNKSAGGRKGFPQLEGIRIDGHWAIIYSKFDLGCALERHAGIDCKGYVHETALRIASNIVIYATMP
jgi:hypothetical protein